MSWAATVLLFTGTAIIPQYPAIGWALRGVGDSLWVLYGIRTNQSAIVVSELVFLLLDLKHALGSP